MKFRRSSFKTPARIAAAAPLEAEIPSFYPPLWAAAKRCEQEILLINGKDVIILFRIGE